MEKLKRTAFRKTYVEYEGKKVGVYAMHLATPQPIWIVRIYKTDQDFSAIAVKLIKADNKYEADKVLKEMIKRGEQGLLELYQEMKKSGKHIEIEKEKDSYIIPPAVVNPNILYQQ